MRRRRQALHRTLKKEENVVLAPGGRSKSARMAWRWRANRRPRSDVWVADLTWIMSFTTKRETRMGLAQGTRGTSWVSSGNHSETRKCLMIVEDIYWLPSCFMLYPIPCSCGLCAPPFGKIGSFPGMLLASDALQCGSCKAFPISVAPLYRNSEEGIVDPGKRACRKSHGECNLD